MLKQLIQTCFLGGLIAVTATVCPHFAAAAEVNFAGKTVTLVISSNAGGGTDNMARLVGRYLREYLPGKPTVIYQNIPGAGGIKALNYFSQQVKPDGLTSIVGSASNLDPTILRTPSVQYDTKKLLMYGGFPAPSGVLILRKDALSRLTDKSKSPVVIGNENAVRTSDQMAVWGPAYLGWNVRWVLGYPGSTEIILAGMRGEVDLVATYERTLISRLEATGDFIFLTQTGDIRDGKRVRSPHFPDVPIFSELIRSKLKDTREIKAFEAWETLAEVGKWLALPPNTPPEFVAAYRKAFTQIVNDKQFLAEAPVSLGLDFTTATGEEMQRAALRADEISDDTLKFFDDLRERVGIHIEAKN
jgi:tripartite-type tricarboxylate transporter receptor subunit TctC